MGTISKDSDIYGSGFIYNNYTIIYFMYLIDIGSLIISKYSKHIFKMTNTDYSLKL